MYCNNCGKHNPIDSKFCKSCGSQIVRVDDDNNKSHSNASTAEAKGKMTRVGLGGWLGLVGVGITYSIFMQGYGAYQFLPLLSKTFEIPGYLMLLQFEFLAAIVFTIINIYLLYLYFKKNINFPKYYIISLMVYVVLNLLDQFFLVSLVAPTMQLQNVINNASSENISNVSRNIIFSLIWISYMAKSKQVKATFINK